MSSGSDVGMLASIDCATLHPTIGELQGRRITIASDRVCATLRDLASATPVSDRFVDDANDPWHTIGRVRVLPADDAWFLVFVARASTGFRPELSLRHRRGAGWAIVGHYDGASALERLGLLEQIDSAQLASPASRGVRDERVAM